jgi:hypothetical protein
MFWNSPSNQKRLKRLFEEGFSAMDIAEPLFSFDLEQPAMTVHALLEEKAFDVVGVRHQGIVCGYACKNELGGGVLGDYLHPFAPEDLVIETDSLQKVIQTIGNKKRCFVKVLGTVGAIVTLSDLEKPPVRMFLFGMITIFEMMMTWGIRMYFPGESWREHIPPGRLAKAEMLRQERERRNCTADSLDCLQFSDRGQLLLKIPRALELLSKNGIPSKKAALKAIQELETLRNNIAHSQEIVSESWQRIVIFSTRLELLLSENLPA